MTQIALTEDAIIRLLESCDFPGVTIMSAPHSWDDGFVQRLLSKAPALLVAFVGADDPEGDFTELNLDSQWHVYVVTGWNGKGQEERRRGVGAGYALLHSAGAALHKAVLTEENGDRLPLVEVKRIMVEADSQLDLANLWVASLALEIELPLPLVETDACHAVLHDWLRWRGGIDIEGGKATPATAADAYADADLPVGGDLPQ